MRTQRHADRHRLRGWPLPLALIAPLAQAAAYLPGPSADPPTGDTAPVASPDLRATEPLRAEGFQWQFGPWQRRGLVTLDGRWLRSGDGTTLVQGVTHTQFDMRSYLWQPWFAQVRFGAGVLTSNARQNNDINEDSRRNMVALTGQAALALFPQSRFPFEFRADFSDTRAGGETLSGDVETRRVTLTQSYRPISGNDRLQLQIDYSRLQSDFSADTLTTVMASASRQRGFHTWELSSNLSLNRTDEDDQRTRLGTLIGRHAFQPSSTLQVDTLATLTDFRTEGVGLDNLTLGTQVRQVSSLATWRPQPGQPLYREDKPVQLAGSLRWIEARAVGDLPQVSAQSLSATAGGSVELSRIWRAGAALSASYGRGSDGEDTRTVGGSGNLSWTPDSRPFGEWSYAPSAGLNLGLTHSDGDDEDGGRRWLAGVQAGHVLSRQWRLSDSQAVSLNLSQSAGVLHESRADELARSLAHGVGLYWQSVGDGSTQRFASLSLTDARTLADQDGNYQFASLSLNQRSAISRFTSWSANVSVQASRNDSTEIDTFTGAQLTRSNGWQTYYSGGLGLEQQRLFGVPRLRHSLQLTFNSQQVERREFGDIDATRERVSAALESRVDYGVGRLQLRFIGRLARIEQRTVVFLMARAQRSF